MNILQRLIAKQIWKQKIVWEGFLKCCERTVPHCVPVLLHLPTDQLSEIFEQSHSLKTAVKQYVNGLSDEQLTNIANPVLDLVKRVKTVRFITFRVFSSIDLGLTSVNLRSEDFLKLFLPNLRRFKVHMLEFFFAK